MVHYRINRNSMKYRCQKCSKPTGVIYRHEHMWCCWGCILDVKAKVETLHEGKRPTNKSKPISKKPVGEGTGRIRIENLPRKKYAMGSGKGSSNKRPKDRKARKTGVQNTRRRNRAKAVRLHPTDGSTGIRSRNVLQKGTKKHIHNRCGRVRKGKCRVR